MIKFLDFCITNLWKSNYIMIDRIVRDKILWGEFTPFGIKMCGIGIIYILMSKCMVNTVNILRHVAFFSNNLSRLYCDSIATCILVLLYDAMMHCDNFKGVNIRFILIFPFIYIIIAVKLPSIFKLSILFSF